MATDSKLAEDVASLSLEGEESAPSAAGAGAGASLGTTPTVPEGKEVESEERPRSGGAEPRSLSRTSKPKPKASTTSTLYIRSSLTMPDLDQISLGVATVLHCQISTDPDAGDSCPPEFKKAFKLFNQDTYLRPGSRPTVHTPPDIMAIFTYVKQIFDLAQFTPECNVLALVYINRLIAYTKIPLTAPTWRLVVLSSLLLAQKVWDDRCLANVDFPVIWGMVMPDEAHRTMFDLKAINKIERRFLELLQYNVTVSTGLYAKYYFELRSLAEENNIKVTMKALTAEQGRALEVVSREKRDRLAGGESVLPVSLTLEDVTAKRSSGRTVLS